MIIFEQKVLGYIVSHTPLIEVNAIKAGQWAKGLKFAGKTIGSIGVGFIALDMHKNGLTTSNSLDGVMSVLALSGYGTGVAVAYFIVNGGITLITGKDSGQHIDEIVK